MVIFYRNRNMVTVSVAHAKAHLSDLLDKVETGEHVVITRHGRPVACLSAAAQSKAPLRPLKEFRAKMPRWRKSSALLLRKLRDEAL
jgi:prevent-host-death family protein